MVGLGLRETLEDAYKRRKLEIRALVSHFSFCKREKEKERERADSLGFGRNQFRPINSLSKITKFGGVIPNTFIVIIIFTEVNMGLNSMSYWQFRETRFLRRELGPAGVVTEIVVLYDF